MRAFVDGEWREYDATNERGEFERATTSFRSWIGDEPDAEFPAEKDRYHLYVSYACPWAHRTLVTRKLRGLEDVISVDVVDPWRGDDGWGFSPEKDGCTPDTVNGADYLRELYVKADENYTGRVTVPVLWDKDRDTIVNNESREVMRILDTGFEEYANDDTLLPEGKEDEVDRILDEIYPSINNGVYRAGFAESQEAYDEAVGELFDALNRWDNVLADQRYLVGDELTEADVAMFTTLVRFDHVYHTTATTLREVVDLNDYREDRWQRIADYPNLGPYLRDLYQTDGVSETVNIAHIAEHYGCPGSPPGFDPYDRPPEEVEEELSEPHDRDQI
ncbi:MAG: glutathione S-transferase family protein [Halobacteriales archaeon]